MRQSAEGGLSRCRFLVYSLLNINELAYKSTKFNTRRLGAVRLHICLAIATNSGDLERPDFRIAKCVEASCIDMLIVASYHDVHLYESALCMISSARMGVIPASYVSMRRGPM